MSLFEFDSHADMGELQAEIVRLEAEVERLTKRVEELERYAESYGPGLETNPQVDAWLDKEGGA